MRRRVFLETALAAAAMPVVASSLEVVETDVAVIGAGAAGLTAAAWIAGNSDLHVTVFEAQPLVGGTSLLCGGQWAVAETDLQKKKHLEDSFELFFEDMLRVGKNANDPSLVRNFIGASHKQYQWVREHGVEPKTLSISAGMSVPRAHIFNPQDIFALLCSECAKHKVDVKTYARVSELLTDPDKQSICGLRAKIRDKDCIVKTKTVVLASGGFARNKDLLKTFSPGSEKVLSFSSVGSQGDGIRMGRSIGAAFADIQNIKPSFGFSRKARGTIDMTGVFYSGAVVVNQDGERFVNESLPNKDIGLAALKQEKTFLVFDEEIRQRQMQLRPNDKILLADVGDHGHIVHAGYSFSELAKKANLPPDILEKTLDNYNEMVILGSQDPLGRNSLSAGWGELVRINRPPFYVMRTFSGILGTYGGLKIDSQTRVLNLDDKPIVGLYAAGEVAGGVHGAGFMAGTGFGKANALGRLAAETILS